MSAGVIRVGRGFVPWLPAQQGVSLATNQKVRSGIRITPGAPLS